MMDGNLNIRFNHFDTTQFNKSGGDAGTIAQRVTRIDITSQSTSTTQPQLLYQATQWVMAVNPGFTAQQVQDEVARQIGVTTELQNTLISEFNAGTISSTQDQRSKGNELEVNYTSPSKFWTVSASATDTQTINSNVSADIQQWLDQRLPIWTTIKDPRGADHLIGTPDDATPVNWWTTNYGGSQTPLQNYIQFVQTPFSLVRQLDGKANPQASRYATKVSSSYKLAGFSDNKTLKNMTVGGSWRWQSKVGIGYNGVPDANGIFQSLDANRPIYDKAHNYFDAFVSYRTSLWNNKIRANFQFNVRNIQESGHLQPVSADPTGIPNTYRIVDPRQFILTASFDL
jgi:hypothetical protein